MGEFFKFAGRYAALAAWAVLAVAVAVFGFVQDGTQLIAGLRGWPFQLAGFLAFAGFVIAALYRFHQEHVELARPAASVEPEAREGGEPQTQKRQLDNMAIVTDRCRRAIEQSRYLAPSDALWPHMRAQLLTLSKMGVPVPDESGQSMADLRRATEFMTEVLPLLRSGHLAEAADQAQRWLARR